MTYYEIVKASNEFIYASTGRVYPKEVTIKIIWGNSRKTPQGRTQEFVPRLLIYDPQGLSGEGYYGYPAFTKSKLKVKYTLGVAITKLLNQLAQANKSAMIHNAINQTG